ncbi:hypothetical protein MCUN1_002717 [Malassezia cuniculi]|uniref:NADP-dependent oxidoreductase domain-containing protein n=1 Tax=Malassezia cuniculi TaxID=948313 RepID=A0AAF0J7N2_9BASI|nr:hypothetical protein MCUN1_002717 [Malassezia cuniculi]
MASSPSLVYGTAWKDVRTADLVLLAFVHGFRAVDTAAQPKHYREDLVGRGLQAAALQLDLRRHDYWVQTKFTPAAGQDLSGALPYNPDDPVAEQVCASFQSSLRNLFPDQDIPNVKRALAAYAESRGGKEKHRGPGLQPTYIDSYLLHSPLLTLEHTVQAWRVMELLVDAGFVREIGFSNVYSPEIFSALYGLARIKPSVLQNRWHSSTGHDVSLLSLLSPSLSPNTFPTYADGSTPRGIVYQPFWTLTGNPALLRSESVVKMCIKHDLTPAQVVYAYVHQGLGIAGLTGCVLTGTSDENHMREAVAATQLEPWSEEDISMVRQEVYGE